MNNFCSRNGGAVIADTYFPIMPASLRRERASEKKIMYRRHKRCKQAHKNAHQDYKYQNRESKRQQKLTERPWHEKLANKVNKMFAARGR